MSYLAPLVTFIIPAYNSSIYIKRCLDSILSQEYSNIEIVVIDDGSTDDTLEKLNKIALMDKRIRVFHKPNEGQGVARNFGLLEARGKYISFVDSDDYISDHFLARLIECLNCDNDFDFINFRIDFRTDLNVVKYVLPEYSRHHLTGDEIFKRAMLDDLIYSSPCNKIYNADFLKKNNIFFPHRRKNEDILFSRVLSFFSTKCLFINDVLYHAEIRADSTSRKMSCSSIKETISIYAHLEHFLVDKKKFLDYEIYLSASRKKVFTQLVILCSIRIKDNDDYIKTVEVFKKHKSYCDFKSMKGIGLLRTKNKLLYLFVRFSGFGFIRFMSSTFLQRYIY
ncbi:glycosyltransferase family 2 protein [Aeromonas veronii]